MAITYLVIYNKYKSFKRFQNINHSKDIFGENLVDLYY